MKASRHVKPFEKEVDTWERILSHILEVIEMILQVQRQWMYLEVKGCWVQGGGGGRGNAVQMTLDLVGVHPFTYIFCYCKEFVVEIVCFCFFVFFPLYVSVFRIFSLVKTSGSSCHPSPASLISSMTSGRLVGNVFNGL